jgi:hypothetical protein
MRETSENPPADRGEFSGMTGPKKKKTDIGPVHQDPANHSGCEFQIAESDNTGHNARTLASLSAL